MAALGAELPRREPPRRSAFGARTAVTRYRRIGRGFEMPPDRIQKRSGLPSLLLRIHPCVRADELDRHIREGDLQRLAVRRPATIRRDKEGASLLVIRPRR